MGPQPVSEFIAHARSKGMDHQTIRMLLLSAGWKEKDIAEAMASETLTMPVPLPPDIGSARDAFFHLLSFTALTSTVLSLIFLAFDFLNRLLPDPAFPMNRYGDDVSSVRWELAVLFVSFPLFLWMARLLQREYARHHEKLASGVRRWLTYLILFVTACTLVGDLIALIFSLLQGEITTRFLLKVIALFILAGLPFTYYLRALRLSAESFTKDPMHRLYQWISVGIVLIAIVGGFFITGSPLRGRAERFDEQRLQDLRAIHGEILNITLGSQRGMPVPPGSIIALQKPLPKTLEDVSANAVYQRLSLVDPETGTPYGYRVLAKTTYELCATFALDRSLDYDIFWNHSAGEKCYEFDALEMAK